MAEIPIFTCKPYGVKLTPDSCAQRHRKALQPAKAGRPAFLAADCVECRVGRAHAAGTKPRGVTYDVRTTSLARSDRKVELPPDAPPPPRFDERAKISKDKSLAKAAAKLAAERGETRPSETTWSHDEVVVMVREHLDRDPSLTVRELLETLNSTHHEGARKLSRHAVDKAIKAITGGVDRRKLGLGGHYKKARTK